MWWCCYCFKEGKTDENIRKHKRATSLPSSGSNCMPSKAGFSVSCEAKARGRVTKEVFFVAHGWRWLPRTGSPTSCW